MGTSATGGCRVGGTAARPTSSARDRSDRGPQDGARLRASKIGGVAHQGELRREQAPAHHRGRAVAIDSWPRNQSQSANTERRDPQCGEARHGARHRDQRHRPTAIVLPRSSYHDRSTTIALPRSLYHDRSTTIALPRSTNATPPPAHHRDLRTPLSRRRVGLAFATSSSTTRKAAGPD
jgi:hypothetical protein